MQLAVAATAPFGADVLERLAARHEIMAVLTRPDAPRGRGQKTGAPPAKQSAERLGIPVLQPRRPEPGLDLGAGTIVVAAYGLLIPEDVLEEGLWLNVHPSLLPRWRGAAPVERMIMAGDTETGVTIHRTVKELDAAGRGRRDVRGEDHRRRSRARLERAARGAPEPHPRAVATHRRSRRAARAPGDDLEGAHRRREARA